MFRVHFTAADIARTRVGPAPGPLTEAVFSLDALQRATGQRAGHDIVLDGWREQMGRRVRLDGATRLLADLLPRAWAFDLITLGGGAGATLDEAAERLDAAPRALVRAEMEHGAGLRGTRTPAWAAGLFDGDRDRTTRDEVAAALRRWFRMAVAPYWIGIRALLEAERRRLTRLAGERGVEALLASLHPSMRWQAPVLHMPSALNGTHDCHLDGRGLVIVPSLFCPAAYPVCRDLAEAAAPLVLYYPAIADPFAARPVWTTGARSTDAALVALLGKTRARVLQALGEGGSDGDGDGSCSTTDLAARAGVAVSSASEHATVLRRAGLVASRRDRSTVFHWLTPLGVGLLDGGPERGPGPAPGPDPRLRSRGR